MTESAPKLTREYTPAEQRENLARLADYLESGQLRADFDMRRYADYRHEYRAVHCGTVGCAVGHGPFCGLPKLKFESWEAYAERVFGVSLFSAGFLWLFSSSWADNRTVYNRTPQAAAKRIRRYLRRGVPWWFRSGLLREFVLRHG